MGALTSQLRGKEVAAVLCNGSILVIQCHDGSEIRVAWVDDQGNVLKGMPVVEGRGFRIRAERLHELVALPR